MDYAIGSAKSLMADELETTRKDLEVAQKENIDLSRRLNEALQAAKEDQEKATTSLNQARNTNRQLKQANDDLKLGLQKAFAQYKDLVKERDSLVANRKKLAAENEYLGRVVYDERLTWFEQGIAQCHYFFKTPLDHTGFDILKVLVYGQLVTLILANTPQSSLANPEAPSEPPPTKMPVETENGAAKEDA